MKVDWRPSIGRFELRIIGDVRRVPNSGWGYRHWQIDGTIRLTEKFSKHLHRADHVHHPYTDPDEFKA